jgi:hypothetical protein
MRFPEFPCQRRRHLSFRYQHLQSALESVCDLRIVRGLHLGDKAIEARPNRGIGDLILVPEGLERSGVEDEAFEKLQVLFTQGLEPGREGRFHKINMLFNLIEVKKI